MKKKIFLSLIILSVFLIVVAIIPATAKSETIELKFAHFVPPQHAQGRVIENWAKIIEEKSNGNVKVNIYDSAKMGSPFDHYNMVKAGIVDAIYVPHAYTPAGTFPLSSFIRLPFLTKSAEEGTLLFWKVYQKHLMDEHKDVKVLWLFTNPSGQINTKKAVKRLEDLKGIKFGTSGSWIIADTLKLLGAKALVSTVNEMTQAAKIGIIDGVPYSFEVLPPFGAHTQFKFHAIVNLYHEPMLVAMNKNRYESLPSDIKKIIDKNSGENMAITAGRAFDETEKMMKEICLKEGGQEYIVPDEEVARWRERTKPVYDKWVNEMKKKGLPGGSVLKTAMEILPQDQ